VTTRQPYHASILGDDAKLPSRLCVDWDPDWPDCFDLTEEAVTSLSPTAAPTGTVYDKQCLLTREALWLYRSLGQALRLAGALQADGGEP
jgi:hypothetical protein